MPRIENIDEKQHQNRAYDHLPNAVAARLLLLGTACGARIALGADILSGAVFTAGVFGSFAPKLGAALFARLLFGIVITRYVVELVRVLLERGET